MFFNLIVTEFVVSIHILFESGDVVDSHHPNLINIKLKSEIRIDNNICIGVNLWSEVQGT